MAKVIRNCWVYKPQNRWWRYLPRRQDGIREYDYLKNQAMPADFNQPMEETPPKLWLVWVYRKPSGERLWNRQNLLSLLGLEKIEQVVPGKMYIFKNTADVNDELWKVKHLLEIRPLRFKNGEPTPEDVDHLEVHEDGRCVIDHEALVDAAESPVVDEKLQLTPSYLSKQLKKRDLQFKDVYPDTVYNPSNVTIID